MKFKIWEKGRFRRCFQIYLSFEEVRLRKCKKTRPKLSTTYTTIQAQKAQALQYSHAQGREHDYGRRKKQLEGREHDCG